MDIGTLALAALFLAIGINAFFPHRVLFVIYGVAALLRGVVGLVSGTALTFWA
jgi:hypothetical protein